MADLDERPLNKILLHCRGGVGRAGTLASCFCIFVQLFQTQKFRGTIRGVKGSEARARAIIKYVRRRRPRAVETKKQEDNVKEFVELLSRKRAVARAEQSGSSLGRSSVDVLGPSTDDQGADEETTDTRDTTTSTSERDAVDQDSDHSSASHSSSRRWSDSYSCRTAAELVHWPPLLMEDVPRDDLPTTFPHQQPKGMKMLNGTTAVAPPPHRRSIMGMIVDPRSSSKKSEEQDEQDPRRPPRAAPGLSVSPQGAKRLPSSAHLLSPALSFAVYGTSPTRLVSSEMCGVLKDNRKSTTCSDLDHPSPSEQVVDFLRRRSASVSVAKCGTTKSVATARRTPTALAGAVIARKPPKPVSRPVGRPPVSSPGRMLLGRRGSAAAAVTSSTASSSTGEGITIKSGINNPASRSASASSGHESSWDSGGASSSYGSAVSSKSCFAVEAVYPVLRAPGVSGGGSAGAGTGAATPALDSSAGVAAEGAGRAEEVPVRTTVTTTPVAGIADSAVPVTGTTGWNKQQSVVKKKNSPRRKAPRDALSEAVGAIEGLFSKFSSLSGPRAARGGGAEDAGPGLSKEE